MHSDGLSIPQSLRQNQQRSSERSDGERGCLCLLPPSASLHIHPCLLFLLVIYNLYHPEVSVHQSPPANLHRGQRSCCCCCCRCAHKNRPGRISNIMSALWGCPLSHPPVKSLSSSLSPRQSPRGGAKPLEHSLLPGDAEAEETAGPRSRVSGYLKKAAQFTASSHSAVHFSYFASVHPFIILPTL